MFFAASKILAVFLVPSNIFIGLIIAGAVLLLTRFVRVGRRLVALGVILVIAVGLSPIGLILLRVLEDRFPAWDAGRGAPTGFVILGGAIDPDLSAARSTPAIDSSAERVTIVAELARRYPEARFIYSSGNGTLFGGEAEADHALALLETFGIARERVTLERNSRNTTENAQFSKALAAPKPGERWVLVTTGTHMPRAIGAFRAAGFEVEAFPVDWRTRGATQSLAMNTTFLGGLGAFDAAAREFVGLAAYRLTGKSSALFPSP